MSEPREISIVKSDDGDLRLEGPAVSQIWITREFLEQMDRIEPSGDGAWLDDDEIHFKLVNADLHYRLGDFVSEYTGVRRAHLIESADE